MENNEITTILGKLKALPRNKQGDELEQYPVETLEKLAVYLYKDYLRKGIYNMIIWRDILGTILCTRVGKLNDQFEWANENKEKFLMINDKIIQVFETAWNEAISVAKELETRIKSNDDFLKDYEIDIGIDFYMGDEFYGDAFPESIGYVISNPLSWKSPINYSLGHSHFERYLKEKPTYLDTSTNYNIHCSREAFKNNFIGYAMYDLKSSGIWSFKDIINIKMIRADVKVFHQYYEEL
jgi:hypothetical protein